MNHNLCAALFLALILNWSKASGVVDGLIKGAIFGSLFTAIIDLSFWSMTMMYSSLAPVLVGVVVRTVVFALEIVIVLTWGKEKTTLR